MTMNAQLKLQTFAFAVRQQLRFPLHATANESTKFATASVPDLTRSLEVSALAQEMGRDIICFGWASVQDDEPTTISIAYREQDFVDWIQNCQLWAADQDAPMMLVDEVRRQHFVRGARGVLERRDGLPAKKLAAGKRCARRRIRRAAAEMPTHLVSDTVCMPQGARWADHKPRTDDALFVRF